MERGLTNDKWQKTNNKQEEHRQSALKIKKKTFIRLSKMPIWTMWCYKIYLFKDSKGVFHRYYPLPMLTLPIGKFQTIPINSPISTDYIYISYLPSTTSKCLPLSHHLYSQIQQSSGCHRQSRDWADYSCIKLLGCHCTALHCSTQPCITQHCTTVHRPTLQCTLLQYTALHSQQCTTLHSTALHNTVLQYTALHYTALHYSTQTYIHSTNTN